MARKKIVFAIVEGPSDEAALGLLLEKSFSHERVHVHVVHGDITTERGVSSQNILKRVGNCVREYASESHFRSADFERIIHVIDSDGVFIDDEHIAEDGALDGLEYTLENIKCPKRERVIERNALKRSVLARITSCGTVWGIPYSAYYMSCNLDHVLFGKQNSSDAEKRADSLAFAGRYKDDIEGFVSFMRDSEFSVIGGYSESWSFLKEGLHSLERYSNFGICLSSPQDGENL